MSEHCAEPENAPAPVEETPPAEESATGLPAGRRNPPGGKSSLILGWIPAFPPLSIQSSLSLISSSAPAICCTTGVVLDVGPAEIWSTSSSAFFWYLFLKNCFVLFLLFDFDGSTLCICIHAAQPLLLLSYRPETVDRSHSWLPASELSPSLISGEGEGTSRTPLPSHTHLCFPVCLLKSWCSYCSSIGWFM